MAKGIRVYTLFENASGIVKDSDIMIAGVAIGHVEKLSIKHDKALLTLFLKKDVSVRKDARALIRAKSMLGEKYIEIQPVSTTAPLLKYNDEIINTLSFSKDSPVVSMRISNITRDLNEITSNLNQKKEKIDILVDNMTEFSDILIKNLLL